MYKDFRDSLLFYFADKSESVSLSETKESRFSLTIQTFIQDFGLQQFVVVNQQHKDQGFIIQSSIGGSSSWFEHDADFIVTDQKNIALLILSADCVPLIIFDKKKQVIAMIHAGWKGTFQGVLQAALSELAEKFSSSTDDLIAIFGPSARYCCYQVQQDFIDQLQIVSDKFFGSQKELLLPKFLVKKNQDYYFDNNFFLQEILKKFGIKEQNIYNNNALCSMCNPQMCSFRKDTNKQLRQMSMVALI